LFRSHGPLLAGGEHVPPFDCSRCPYGLELPSCGMACANAADYTLEKHGDVAAMISEPLRAAPIIAPAGYWQRMRAACDRQGALLIFDEIATGLGKTGSFFSHAPEGVVPDMVVLGKALGGAMLPLAALLVRGDLDVAGDIAIGHFTHEKNPLLARAGLTTLQIIEEEGLVSRAAELGAYALGRLGEMGLKARGRGLLIGVELDDPALAERVLYACLTGGLSFKLTMGSVLTLSPPLTISRGELDAALDILARALT